MKNKIITTLFAITLLIASSTNAFAATVADQGATIIDSDGNPIPLTNGHTQLGVSTVDSTGADAIKNLVFEVPLSITMSIGMGNDEVFTPTNYYIRNLSRKSPSGSTAAIEYDIVISEVQISTLSTSSFKLVSSDPSGSNEMKLNLGGLIPSIKTSSSSVIYSSKVKTSTSSVEPLIKPGVIFADDTGNKLKKIAYGDRLIIPISATVDGSAHTSTKSGSAEYRIYYQVEPIIKNSSISNVYIGDLVPW